MIEIMQDGAFITEEVPRAGGRLFRQKRIEPGARQRQRQLIAIEAKPLKPECMLNGQVVGVEPMNEAIVIAGLAAAVTAGRFAGHGDALFRTFGWRPAILEKLGWVGPRTNTLYGTYVLLSRYEVVHGVQGAFSLTEFLGKRMWEPENPGRTRRDALAPDKATGGLDDRNRTERERQRGG